VQEIAHALEVLGPTNTATSASSGKHALPIRGPRPKLASGDFTHTRQQVAPYSRRYGCFSGVLAAALRVTRLLLNPRVLVWQATVHAASIPGGRHLER